MMPRPAAPARPRPQLHRCALVPALDSSPTPVLLPPHGSHGIEYGKNYPQRNLSRDFPQIRNKHVTNLRFGWRRSPGRCTARDGLFGLQIGAPSTPQTLFPIAALVTKPSHRRRANSKLAAPSQAPKEVPRAAPLPQEPISQPERHRRTPPPLVKTA
jgi:hypothetical protein